MKMGPRDIWGGFEADGPEWVILETPVSDVPVELQGTWSNLQHVIGQFDPDNLPLEVQDDVEEMVKSVADMIWGPHY